MEEETESKDPRKPNVVTDYKGNSNKSKAEAAAKVPARVEKKVQPVVTGSVKIQKKPLMRRIKSGIDAWDVPGIIRHAYYEVAIPAAQNLFYDSIVDVIGRVTFKDGRRYHHGPHKGSMITYNRPVDRGYRDPREPRDRDRDRGRPTSGPRGRRRADDVIFDTRGEAEDVLEGLNDIIEQYDFASVGDLYELLKRSDDINPVDWKWGWVGIVDAPITRDRDGYRMEFPPVEPLN